MALPLFLAGLMAVSTLAYPTYIPRRSLDFDVDKVTQNAIAIASHSWEYGTLMEALVEIQQPELSVYAKGSIPPRTDKYDVPPAVVDLVRSILNNESSDSAVFIDGAGAAGDPASIGFGVLLANTVENNQTWADDALRQLNHLLYDVPRNSDGGISQREDMVQYWADFMSMVPPFLAYYGALEGGDNGTALLQEAYHQCESYRSVLFDEDVSLWKHILLGTWSLPQRWGTGNGWAALGMMRVLATIRASDVADQFESQQQDLINWTNEILTGAYNFQGPNGTLYNYLDEYSPLTNTTFADTAGTASITAAAYRLMAITGDATHLVSAELAYQLVVDSIDEDGWVINAVDPETFSTPLVPGGHSPEAQAFTLMLKAARDAYYGSY